MPTTRIPFSFVEEITDRHDRAPCPMTMHAEYRLTGRLDEPRLRDAMQAAITAHPMSRARKVAGRLLLRPPLWMIDESADADVLETINCETDAELDAARVALVNRPLDLRSPPAIRFLVARRPDGDSLLVVASHVISDGIGLNRFIHSVARAYTARPDPAPPVDALESRNLRALFHLSNVARHRAADRPNTLEGPLESITPSSASAEDGYGVCQVILPEATQKAFNPRRFGPATSLNDLLLAALHLTIAAWNDRGARRPPAGRIAIFMPLSLRPVEWFSEVVANLTLGGNVTSTPEQRSDAVRLMTSIMDQTQWMKAGGGLSKLLESPDWVYRNLPVVLPLIFRVLGDRGRHSAVLTYFGKVDGILPDFGPEAGEIEEVWGSPPIGMPRGLAVGACVHRGRLLASLRYRRSLFDDVAAGRFAASFLEHLASFARDEGVVPSPEPPGPAVSTAGLSTSRA